MSSRNFHKISHYGNKIFLDKVLGMCYGLLFQRDNSVSEKKVGVKTMAANKSLAINTFLALAEEMWKNGEDGEIIARDIALAFKAICDEGIGTGKDIEEYIKFRNI